MGGGAPGGGAAAAEELARVDALLDDPVFFAPFVPFFDPRLGRPSTPMEVYLRLMFLKFRYRLGYETLCREVADSITWRRFCRIPIDGRVPHPTTLMKLTTRCGTAAVDGLQRGVAGQGGEAKLLRTTRLRADTTVVPANVAYPTDSGLLAKAVRRIAATGRRIQAAGGAARTGCVTAARSAGSGPTGSGRSCGCARRRPATRRRRRSTDHRRAGRAGRAGRGRRRDVAGQRPPGAAHARRRRPAGASRGVHDAAAGRRRGRLRRAVNDLTDLLAATRRIAAQTRQRLAGTTPERGDPAGQPARRRRPARSRRAGSASRSSSATKGQVVDNDDGVVLDHDLEQGNPPMRRNWRPRSSGSSRRTGRRPRTVTADRGYGEASVEDDLHDLGVRTVVIPARADPARPSKPTNTDPARRYSLTTPPRTRCRRIGASSGLTRDGCVRRALLEPWWGR